MKKIFVLSFMFMIAYTAFAEQSFKIKFYKVNGQEPLSYNIYDIKNLEFKNILNKYFMTVYYKKDSSMIYDTDDIDSLNFSNNQLGIYLSGIIFKYSVSEIDSIIFKIKENYIESVAIGSQVWMLKNLDVSTYKNGDVIRYAADSADWTHAANNKEGAWCYYNNDPANGDIYGKLYNWYAVNDPRGLAPEGYHVPSDAEWTALESYLKSNNQYWCGNNSSYVAKSYAAKELWNTYNVTCTIGNDLDANNSSGFSGLPGGYRDSFANTFYSKTTFGGWWSSTEHDATYSRTCSLVSSSQAGRNRYLSRKTAGFYVRCIRN